MSHRVTKLIGQTGSTLGASSLKNFSTVRGSHSFSETVFLVSLSFLGLISSLHRSAPPSYFSLSVAYPYESIIYYTT